MITQKDYFGQGLPIYTVNRYLEELGDVFKDGSHIIYVNGSYRGDDPLGKLMYDFACKNAEDMYYEELAEGVKHFKDEGGREIMCEAVEAYATRKAEEAAKKAAIKTAIEERIAYGIDKERILLRVCDKYQISREKAEEIFGSCLVVEV